MKKIMVMLAMILMASLASPLFANNTSPPTVGCISAINDNLFKMLNARVNVNQNVGAADVAYVKVNVLHRDTLMYSYLDMEDAGTINGFDLSKNANLSKVTLAMVSQLRGEGGV